jgi:peroxiredoxin
MIFRRLLPSLLLACTLPLPLFAQKPSAAPRDPATAWQRIVVLDAGPQTKFKTREEARAGSMAHLARQEKALRDFLAAFPKDEHAFEARLRLARLLQIRAGFSGTEAPRDEARKILDDLYLNTSGPQRAEVDFARVAFLMRTLRMSDTAQREQLLSATQRFKADYPDDRRLPALLSEVAGLLDREPDLKRPLLVEARRLAKDPALTQRIDDDLKRLDFVGKPVPLHVTTRTGKPLDLGDYRGKIVVLVFLADFSPPAAEAVAQIQRASREWPPGAVQILGISLDSKPEELTALIQRENVTWPVAFDGKGWATPVARSLGINRLPTVWIIDQAGILRSLNGLESTTDQIRKLLKAAH